MQQVHSDPKPFSFQRDGVLLIDKPSGVTSHDVVDHVRGVLKTQKVGHSGTLDPLASGLMVLLINQGTKLSPYLLNTYKTYKVKVALGISTDTWDSDGQVLEKRDTQHLSCEDVSQAIKKFIGKKEFRVPSYSAVKFKGKKLYEYAREYARNGKTKVPVIHRLMSFDQVEITEVHSSHFKMSLRASKGSFVRSYAYTVGEYLKVGGIVTELQRVTSGPYTLDQATSLEALKAYFKEQEDLEPPGFIVLEKVLPDWPEYVVRGRWEKLLKNGQVPEGMQWDILRLLEKNSEGVRIYSSTTGCLLGLLRYGLNKNTVKMACVFNDT